MLHGTGLTHSSVSAQSRGGSSFEGILGRSGFQCDRISAGNACSTTTRKHQDDGPNHNVTWLRFAVKRKSLASSPAFSFVSQESFCSMLSGMASSARQPASSRCRLKRRPSMLPEISHSIWPARIESMFVLRLGIGLFGRRQVYELAIGFRWRFRFF